MMSKKDCIKKVMTYETLVFHATGVGGRVMESFVREGFTGSSLYTIHLHPKLQSLNKTHALSKEVDLLCLWKLSIKNLNLLVCLVVKKCEPKVFLRLFFDLKFLY